jgi:hypothetical protein
VIDTCINRDDIANRRPLAISRRLRDWMSIRVGFCTFLIEKTRCVSTVSLLAASCVAIGLAGPASATDQITQNAVGTYGVKYPWGTYTWVASPCEDDANQCLKVSEFAADDIGLTNPRWSTHAYWSVGWWMTSPVDSPDELVCGEKYTLTFTYAWDAVRNKGWRSNRNPKVCDGTAAHGTQPFTLTKAAPSPSLAPAG